MGRRRARIRRTRSGRFTLKLPDDERRLVRQLLGELRDLLAAGPDDPRLRRLYPPAYPDDPDKDAEFARYMHAELAASRAEAIATVEATLDAANLDRDEVQAWMQALNSLRLVLGTALDVSEDDDPWDVDPNDPDARSYALYGYLGFLLEEIVQAQS